MFGSLIQLDFKGLTIDKINEAIDNKSLYGPLSASKVFQLADSGTKNEKLSSMLPKMVSDEQGFTHVSYEFLSKELIYDLFESKSFKIKNKTFIKEAIIKKNLILVYSEKYKVPASIPYVIRKGTPPTIYVNVSNFTKMTDTGYLECIPRQESGLMAVLFSAYCAMAYTEDRVPTSNVLKTMALTYSGMFGTIIGYNSSISDPIMLTKLKYLGAKFFCIQAYGTENGADLFYRNLSSYFENKISSKQVIDSLDLQFPDDSFDNIELLFTKILQVYPNIKNLSLAAFLENWIKRFGPATTMSIDYVGYMLYVMVSIILGSPAINIRSLDPVVPNTISEAYADLQVLNI